MPTSGDLRSGDFFPDQHLPPTPTEFANTTPYPSPPPLTEQFRGKNVDLSIYLAYIGVTKKKLSSICLQRTTCITQGNEARNRNTSIRSQMISEFWNIRGLNLVGNWSKLSYIWWFLVTRTREREITSVSERLLDNPGELAYMKT